MNIPELCIRRPAFTIVLSLLITIIGIMGYRNLSVRWLPDIKPPVVFISTIYPGASASLIESQVTTPIEAALSGVDGIETLSSDSREGESRINISFKLGHNMNAAVEDVRSALQAVNDLPTDVKTPVVSKADADQNAIMYLAFSNPRVSAQELTDYVAQFIVPRLETIDGVASVLTYGERTSEMRINLDPKKMTALGISVDDINTALTEQNIEVPSGQIRGAKRNYNVVTNETLSTPEQFNNLVLRSDNNQTVRLKDVGIASIDAVNSDSAFRVNGQSAIAVGIIPQSNANPLTVSHSVLNAYADLTKLLPAGMKGNVVYEQASFIHASIYGVYTALLEAVLLVSLVILLFLASVRATFIPIITIPICLISIFGLLALFGFTINTITLMALVLAIGLVVDDAIVMLENIMRHIELGASPFDAAIVGSKEMIFPIIVMTLTLAAVYLPLAFTGGLLSAVFSEFAITLAGTVLISGFLALTLSPMMCSKLLVKKNEHAYSQWIQHQLIRLQYFYQEILVKLFSIKKWIVLLLILIGVLGLFIYHILPTELAPQEDMNEIDIFVSAPRDASFLYTDSYVKQLEEIYKKIPEARSYFTEIASWSPSSSYQEISLVPRNQRKRSADEIVDALSQAVKQITGVTVNVSAPPSPLTWFSGGHGESVALKIMSSGDYKSLQNVMQQFIAAAQKKPIFTHADSQLKWDGEQFSVSINRDKAADSKVSMQAITNTISTLLAGRKVGHFEYGGKQYDIMMQMNQTALSDPNIISSLYVRNTSNQMVPLSDLIKVDEKSSPESLPHFSRLRADTFFASLAPGYTIADAITYLQTVAKQVLPDNAKYSFVGEARDYLESNGKMSVTFLLALIFIYLVLVAQFESFIDPLIILLTVPFALIGALVALKFTGNTLNIYSEIGLVTLIGLIAKHGILITEFANRERAQGISIEEAVIKAAVLRLRPILMTTAAMVLGALPLALASGPGSETRHQIGWVIVGGLLIGTFFSLVVVPVMYTYLAKLKKGHAC